jgi:type I restriction enzyme S subunit
MIRTTNIGNGRIDLSNVRYVDEETYDRWTRRAKLQKGDVLLTREAPLGDIGFVRETDTIFLGQRIMQYRADRDQLDPRFLLYSFLGPDVQAQIKGHAGAGSTVDHIRVPDCEQFELEVPPLPVQRAIGEILGALDDKIELNRKMNRTLEEIAQTLFRAWFVDFEGETDLVDSELGLIPRGWEVVSIGELVQTVGGGTPSTKEPRFWDGGEIHWTTPRDLSGIEVPVLLDTARKITEEGLSKISSGLLPSGTVLMSSRAPVGYTAMAKVPVAVNQGYIAIPPGGELSNYYVLLWLRANMERIKNRAGGTTFREISKRAFRPIAALKPPTEIQERFDELVGPLFERIVLNERQSRTLAALRDTLLPKLISGEIRVPEAEELVEDATAGTDQQTSEAPG